MSDLKAVIFDMDGVIINSHSAAYQLLAEAANKIGCRVTAEEIKTWGSLSSRQFWNKVKNEYDLPYGIPFLIQSYDREKEIELYKKMEPIPGVVFLLNTLRSRGIRTALATSASKKRMSAVLEIFELTDKFEVCICDEDVKRSKPDPEIFIRAAEELNILQENCTVIEDSENGITAAKRAGMKSIGYDGLEIIDEDLSEADHIVSDIKDIKSYIIQQGEG